MTNSGRLGAELPLQAGLQLAGEHLNQVAFPLGGLGAGSISLEGTGSIFEFSPRPVFNEFGIPVMFSALHLSNGITRVLQGQVPTRKIFGATNCGSGLPWSEYGLPRCAGVNATATFPFMLLELDDPDWPIETRLLGWSPFIPGNADDSGLPAAALEYEFLNTGTEPLDAVFSYSNLNCMVVAGLSGARILAYDRGFKLYQPPAAGMPQAEGWFVAEAEVSGQASEVVVNHAWFQGAWWDCLMLNWQDIANGVLRPNPPQDMDVNGATLSVPLRLEPGVPCRVVLRMSWYAPVTQVKAPDDGTSTASASCCSSGSCATGTNAASGYYAPWYSTRFASVDAVAQYWSAQYSRLREESVRFTQTLFDTSLPRVLMEAVTANLSILKTPTLLREADGRFWGWEGLNDTGGCCYGSCTHVWNYQQALAHLFPAIERDLRETEFNVMQMSDGYQNFRVNLPISPPTSRSQAAVDGQLGGLIKLYREWRISGDTDWLRSLWTQARQSLDYCIATWDPDHAGLPVEPHHNTFDIEFWGPDAMAASFYAGALKAACLMGEALGEDVSAYADLLQLCITRMAGELYNGEYYQQNTQWQGLHAQWPGEQLPPNSVAYTDVVAEINATGPKYQYGTGCMTEALTGLWLARACGLQDELQPETQVANHLRAVVEHNFRENLRTHANPERPGYAMGNEPGLVICTWPRGGRTVFPLVYCDEVWTGAEYQMAGNLLWSGERKAALKLIAATRSRYDGRVRNPFDEYECGYYYARALASWALLAAWTGLFYDALAGTLYLNAQQDPFRAPLFAAGGYGTVHWDGTKVLIQVAQGTLAVQQVLSGTQEIPFDVVG